MSPLTVVCIVVALLFLPGKNQVNLLFVHSWNFSNAPYIVVTVQLIFLENRMDSNFYLYTFSEIHSYKNSIHFVYFEQIPDIVKISCLHSLHY